MTLLRQPQALSRILNYQSKPFDQLRTGVAKTDNSNQYDISKLNMNTLFQFEVIFMNFFYLH